MGVQLPGSNGQASNQYDDAVGKTDGSALPTTDPTLVPLANAGETGSASVSPDVDSYEDGDPPADEYALKQRSVSFGGAETIAEEDEDDEGEGAEDDDVEDEENEFDEGDDDEEGSEEEGDVEDYEEDDDDADADDDAHNDISKSGLSEGVISHLLNKDRVGTKALHAAAAENDVENLSHLLDPETDPKVDVDVTDAYEYTALHIAAENGALEAVSVLIDAGASLEPQSRMYQCRPLHYAAFQGHTDVVRALVKAGADINALTEDGRTPLFQAAFLGHLDCVKALVELKADATIANNEGKTPADVAKTSEICDILQAPPNKKVRTD